MEFKEFLVLLWGGVAVAILGGTLASAIAHIPFPEDFLFYAPGWVMMVIAVLVTIHPRGIEGNEDKR